MRTFDIIKPCANELLFDRNSYVCCVAIMKEETTTLGYKNITPDFSRSQSFCGVRETDERGETNADCYTDP